MSAQSHRLFVGNLPHEATQDEILSKFKKYGNVESVEIRTKKDPSTGDPLATFSFVNINADRETVNQCAHLLNGIKIGGRNIKVEVAKESFLQRLQRERQAGNKTAPPPVVPPPSAPPKPKESITLKPVAQKKVVPKKPVSSSSESSDSEDEDVRFHQTSKLPMFKGIKSPEPIESKPQVEKDKKTTFSNSGFGNGNGVVNKHFTNTQSRSENSDILKKFESFSDVWGDDDEPSYQNNAFGSKFRKNEKNQGFDKFSNRNSFSKKEDNWQSRNQPHQRNASNVGKFPGNAGPVSAAEEKRLKSLDEKRQAFEQQKQAVKMALSDTSASRMNKKVVFGDDDDEDVEQQQQPQEKQHSKRKPEFTKDQKQNTLSLFNESDDEANDDEWKSQFEVKKQFQGEKGKKLLQLQSNFNNDRRFNIDERFYEGEDETNPKPSHKPPTTADLSEEGFDAIEGIEGLAEEREQQLQILSSILGQSIPTTQPTVHHESKAKGMLRFDPSKPNHIKYELSKEPKEKKKRKKGKNEGEEEEDDDEEESNKRKFRREEKEPEPVSQNKFYNVSDSLANSLRQSKEGQSSGFSLLSMFGAPSVPSESFKEKETVTRVEPMRKEVKKRPILDDSSSDEEGPTAAYNAPAQSQAFPASNPGVRSSHGVWQESFFLQSGDSRLKEGNDFLSVNIDKPTDIAPKRYAILKGLKKKQIKHDSVWRKNDMPKPNSWKGASKSKVHSFKPKRKERKLAR